MNVAKQKRLASAGWTVGSAAEFLGLSAEDGTFIEMTLGLAAGLREFRERQGLTQIQLAERLG